MLARQRHEAILELVRRQGGVRVSELVQAFGVSDATIRHDLEILAGNGFVAKVHGGAIRPLDERVSHRREKEAIGALAASLIRPGAAVAISGGTTSWAAARYIAGIAGLTIVTNSVPVAEVLHQAKGPQQTIILTGGIRTASDALVGSVAVAAIRSLHFDVALISVHGMTERTGFTTSHLLEAEANRAMVAASRRLIVLADHSKWATIGISTVAQLCEADVLISDEGLDNQARQALSAEVTELLIAS